ncbi:MAG: MTAP family purine nucleoside phosphorylase [Solirubrobacterales bacterium]
MARLALIAGSSLRGAGLPDGEWVVAQRHGEAAAYVLPDRIDHVANLRALADAGCDRVLALGSVGGLRPDLGPGTLLCPDDFIALTTGPVTALEGPAAHRVPGFDREWRAEVVAAFTGAGAELRDGGVYWQSTGPRLETPAEIRLIAAHADVIGMTIATESVVAGELGLRYAAVCIVDNLANGVGERPLTLDEIEANRARHRNLLADLVTEVLPAIASG